jgi:hypothetical protein
MRAALGAPPPSASALRGLQSARAAEASALHATFASAAQATAQRRQNEVRTVSGQRRFPLKFMIVIFGGQKPARETRMNWPLNLGCADLRAVGERRPVSIGTPRGFLADTAVDCVSDNQSPRRETRKLRRNYS